MAKKKMKNGIQSLVNGKYRAFVWDRSQNRRISKTWQTHKQAKTWKAQTEIELRQQVLPHYLREDRHTVEEAIDLYIKEEFRNLAQSTQGKRAMRLDIWRQAVGHLLVDDLQPRDIVDTLKMLGDVAPATRNRYLAAIRRVLNWVMKTYGWISVNPAANVGQLREDNKVERYLSDDERDRLLRACQASQQPLLYPVVVLGLYTGGRRGELLALTPSSFDFERKTLTFWHSSKGERRTKSGKSRAVPLHSLALEVAKNLCDRKDLGDLLFVSSSNPNKSFDFKRSWGTACKNAGLDDFRFHDLRHSFASNLAKAGANLQEIAALMGHADIQTTMRYTHLIKGRGAEFVNRFG